MKPKKKNKKREPQDATMRNVRATNKKFTKLLVMIEMIDIAVTRLLDRVYQLERKVKK